jgi:hypothetical protein
LGGLVAVLSLFELPVYPHPRRRSLIRSKLLPVSVKFQLPGAEKASVFFTIFDVE